MKYLFLYMVSFDFNDKTAHGVVTRLFELLRDIA